MLSLRLFPAQEKFFDLLDKSAVEVARGGQLFEALVANYNPEDPERVRPIKTCEKAGDDLHHKIIDELNLTFVTPFDREDIHALSDALDDILDYMHDAAQRLRVYRIREIPVELRTQGALLRTASAAVAGMVHELRDLGKKREEIQRFHLEIRSAEKEGDRLLEDAIIPRLFFTGMDPLEVIKWREIHEYAESAIDACERAAQVILGVVLKHA